MNNEYEVAVVGAGFAGLSCSARLRSLGLKDFVMIEKGAGFGGFWRGNYDRIRLHTPFHDLPDDGGIRRKYPEFLPRDDLIKYLEEYANRHGLNEALYANAEVTSIARDQQKWKLEIGGESIRSDYLVVATAYNRKPVWPDIEGIKNFTGTALHSREYRNAKSFRNSRALVVGNGNSAAEIALDLAQGGCAKVKILSRGARHVLSLSGLGIAARIARFFRIELTPKHIEAAHAYTRSHPDFEIKLKEKDKFFSTFSIDMSAYGISQPESGPATQIAVHGRVPWMDQGTVKAIRNGAIEVIDGKVNPLARLTESGAQFRNGHEEFDVIIFATGMEPGLDELFDEPQRFLTWNHEMARLMPLTDGRSRSTVDPTLFFPGFDLSANGGLSLGLWGFECADAIVRHRETNQ